MSFERRYRCSRGRPRAPGYWSAHVLPRPPLPHAAPSIQPSAQDSGAATPASTAATLALVLATRSAQDQYQKAQLWRGHRFCSRVSQPSPAPHPGSAEPTGYHAAHAKPQAPNSRQCSRPARSHHAGESSGLISARVLFSRLSSCGNESAQAPAPGLTAAGRKNRCVLQLAAPSASSHEVPRSSIKPRKSDSGQERVRLISIQGSTVWHRD